MYLNVHIYLHLNMYLHFLNGVNFSSHDPSKDDSILKPFTCSAKMLPIKHWNALKKNKAG